jgi:signal transduction histidine kinase
VAASSRLRRSDIAVAAGLTALGLLELALVRPQGWRYGVAIVLVVGALLVWRRRYPLVISISAAFIELSMPWVGPQLDELATPILTLAVICYTLGRWVETLRGLVGIGLLLLMFLLDYGFADVRSHDVTDVVFVTALTLPPYVFGRISRKLALQSALLQRQQELVKREAIRAERDRIARELHDVIAHSVSAMVVQTAAAQDLVQTDPDRAGAVLGEVASTGRRALAETGRLLHVIRDEADELGLAPAPGLAQLDELVQEFRGNGLEVELVVERPLPLLPAGVDVSAYRIVQEALTNALRYSADRRAQLRVAASAARLTITVSNASDARTAPGSGLGLLGMAERVSLFGGRLQHGRTGDGRFELVATLPVGTADRS